MCFSLINIRNLKMNNCTSDTEELKKRKQGTVYTPEQWVNIMQESANNITFVDVEKSMIKDYKTLFFSWKDPVPLFRNQGNWKVTTYKIIEYHNSCFAVCAPSSGLPTETFQFRQKCVPDFDHLRGLMMTNWIKTC
jgi:hypothetical protein